MKLGMKSISSSEAKQIILELSLVDKVEPSYEQLFKLINQKNNTSIKKKKLSMVGID